MTVVERRYYQIAIGLSILFHAALLLITLPQTLGFGIDSGRQMDTISAELMDFSSGASEPVAPAKIAKKAVAKVVVQPKAKKVQPKVVPPVKTVTKPEIIHKAKVEHSKKVKPPKNIEQPKKKAEQTKTKPKLQPKPEKTKTANHDKAAAVANRTIKTQDGKQGNKTGGAGEGKNPVAGSGNAGKVSGGPRSLGTGENMVAGGLDVQFYYPKNARNESKEGDVQFRAFFNSDGNLEKMEKRQSSGDLRLDNAASKYIKRFLKFKPYSEKYYIDILIMFRIDKEDPVVKWLHSKTRP